MSAILEFLKDLCCSCCNRDRSATLFAAGIKAWNKYEETHDQRYLKKAVRNHQAALDIRAPHHPNRPESLYHTAMALWAECQIGTVTKENSSAAISYYEEALLFPEAIDTVGYHAIVYTNLGQIHFSLYRLGERNSKDFAPGSSLDKAIKNYQTALKLRSAKDDPNRPMALINLSIALVQKDTQTDLTHAITYLVEAAELCSAQANNRHLLLLSLNVLATAYNSRYNYSGDINDVIGKVEALRMILGLADKGKGRLIPLLNLSNALWRLCEVQPLTRRDEFNEAVERGQEALELSDPSDKNNHVKVLKTLANVLFTRYTQSSQKSITDLNQAIRYYREAINPDPQDPPDHLLCSSLASAIYTRCQDFGEADGVTLEHAISSNLDASRTCPKDDPLYLKIQNNLGNIYLTRFNKSGEEGDLLRGIQSYEAIDSHCPAAHVDYAYYTNTLENANKALRDIQEGRTGTPLSVVTFHQYTTVTTWLRS